MTAQRQQQRRARASRTAYRTLGSIAAITLGGGFSARAANLLINPGFESPTDLAASESPNVFGWTLTSTTERETFQNHTLGGRWSIWAETFKPAGQITQLVPGITGNTDYTLSSQLYFEANYNTSNATIKLGMTWKDAGNNNVGSATFLNIDPTSNPATGAWNPFSVMGTAPALATQVEVSLGWLGNNPTGQQIAVFFDDADLEGIGTPPNSTWIVNGSGDWNISDNWANSQVPSAIGAEADFFGAITAPHTVYSDIAVTAGSLNFNNPNTYVISGAGSLTLQVAAGNAQINVQQGTHKINLPLVAASNTVFNVAAGAQLIIADPLTINTGKSVTQTGAGSVTYQSIITVQTGGSIAFGNATHAAALNLQGTSNASVTTHSGTTQKLLQLDSLTINPGSKLNLTNNALLVPSTPQAMRQLLQSGAIFTSMAAGGHAIGYAAQPGGLVKARYTYSGDANLDGQVDVTDLGALATNWQTSNVWTGGDFDYSGFVDVTDLGQLATNWQQGVGNPLGKGSFEDALAAVGLGSASVPEPASLGAIALLVSASLVRRNRRH